MYHPTTRVLAVLALLQAHGRMSGAELANRIEVNVRTLRRYIIMLQDLGIPIEAERGRNGAYVLSAGFKLPPMMFTNEEALALTVGLVSARHLNLADTDRAIESAIAKLPRVVGPPTLHVAGVHHGAAVLAPCGDTAHAGTQAADAHWYGPIDGCPIA